MIKQVSYGPHQNKDILHAINQVSLTIEIIKDLMDLEYPYNSYFKVLENFKDDFTIHLEELKNHKKYNFGFEANDDILSVSTLSETLERTYKDIKRIHPLCGIMIRSTNVRNGFEAYLPLHKLIERIFKESNDVEFIMSAEWDHSELTYSNTFRDDGIVWFGYPVTESNNPLLLSLAGHEFGHLMFESKGKNKIFETITSIIGDKYYNHILKDSTGDSTEESGKSNNSLFSQDGSELNKIEKSDLFRIAYRQAEEVYCDLVGLLIFRTAFIDAYMYKMKTYKHSNRFVEYPDLKCRTKMLDCFINRLKKNGYIKEYGKKIKENLNKEFLQNHFSNAVPNDIIEKCEIAESILSDV